jgi:hypothetical protein
VLPTKPLVPNLEELVRIGVDFSAAANVTIGYRADQRAWVVVPEKSSWILVYDEDGDSFDECVQRSITVPSTGGAFAIALGRSSGVIVDPYGENYAVHSRLRICEDCS